MSPPLSAQDPFDASWGMELYQQEQVAQTEFAIEQEVAHLRAIECGTLQLQNIAKLLQAIRDEQISTRKRLDQLLEIVGS